MALLNRTSTKDLGEELQLWAVGNHDFSVHGITIAELFSNFEPGGFAGAPSMQPSICRPYRHRQQCGRCALARRRRDRCLTQETVGLIASMEYISLSFQVVPRKLTFLPLSIRCIPRGDSC